MAHASGTLGFERKTATLSAGAMDYYVAGDGEPIVFLHGTGGLRWTRPLQMLSEKFRVHLPIYPGFDGSAPSDKIDSMPALASLIADFIGKEIGTGCDVIGLSFGGWTACWLAANHPEMVELLVLEAPAGFRPGGKGGLQRDPDGMQRMLFTHPENRLPEDDRTFEETLANYDAGQRFHGGIALDEDLVAKLADIRSSTLLLYGTAEIGIPPETVHILKENLPKCDVIYVYDAAHQMQVDQPERYFNVVSDYLERGEAFIVRRSELSEAS